MFTQLASITVSVAVALFACQVQTKSSLDAVPTGSWGGKGMELTVTASGGSVDYGCDSGTIDERLRTDSSGRFSARGSHTFGQGGPSRPGEASKARKALYEGVRKGDMLEVTIQLPEVNRKLGPFTVKLGKPSTLERCG